MENSTIAHNGSYRRGRYWQSRLFVIRNSAIIFNDGLLQMPAEALTTSAPSTSLTAPSRKTAVRCGGGGIYNCGGLVSITNSTIRENQVPAFPLGVAGGIWNDGGALQVRNSIIAGNTFRGDGQSNVGIDCFGTITSFGNNLVGDPSGCGINLQPSDLTGDPGLGIFVGGGEDDLPGRAFYPVLAGSAVIDKGNPNACLQTDQLGNLRVGICDIGAVEFRGPMLASVDIRPKKDANRINPNSTKNINVAIFSVNGFDATSVDPNTVRFGATGMEAAPISGAIRDVDGDGHFDMVLRFQILDTGIKCGDTLALLTGQISNGPSIIGSSPIKTVECKQQQ